MTKHWESIVLGYVRPKAQSNRELTFTAFCLFDLQLDLQERWILAAALC